MTVLELGHTYELNQFVHKDFTQKLTFVKKVPKEEGSKELVLSHDGVTNEEVLDVLIDRMEYLDKKVPSWHTTNAIILLKEAKAHLNARAEDREKRGVKGTNNL